MRNSSEFLVAVTSVAPADSGQIVAESHSAWWQDRVGKILQEGSYEVRGAKAREVPSVDVVDSAVETSLLHRNEFLVALEGSNDDKPTYPICEIVCRNLVSGS